MVRSYKKKEEGSRKSYASSQAMTQAYNAVMGKTMSAYQASKHFGVDKKSLLRRVRGEIPVNAHCGRTTVLSSTTGQELANCLIVLSEWGWGFGKEEVKDIVQSYISDNNIDNPFNNNRPGPDWLHDFLTRHPNVASRKTEHLSNSRARSEDPEVIDNWFNLLDKTLTEAGVKGLPSQLFNCDESGFVTDPKTQVVLARKGASRVNQAIGGSGREQITVNCAVSASGQVLPPYIIYKGKHLYMDWTQGGPEGAAFTTSSKGWMEGPQFLDWFKVIFLKNTSHLASRTRILIFDGHSSHISEQLIKEGKANNVILLRLPSHLTHLLQPLDTAVFGPVKRKWQSLLVKYARTHAGPVSKKHFPGMLKALFESSFTEDQVKGGFRGTGIFPFNKDAIDTSSFHRRPHHVGLSLPPPNTFLADRSTAPSATEASSSASSSTTEASSSASSSTTVESMAPSPPPMSSQGPAPSSTTVQSMEASPATVPSHGPASSSSVTMDTTPSRTASSRSSTPSSEQSIRDFFLKELQPRFEQASGRGRSARVMRFRYGESLTGEECLQRLQQENRPGSDSSKGKGKGKKRRRDVESSEDEDGDVCHKCGAAEGDDNWVCCDICAKWYHLGCTDIPRGTNIESVEWVCDFCHQPL